MNHEKHTIMGAVRNSAKLAYDAAEALETYALDPINHLSNDDLAVIRNARGTSREAWRKIEKITQMFSAQANVRQVFRENHELKV